MKKRMRSLWPCFLFFLVGLFFFAVPVSAEEAPVETEGTTTEIQEEEPTVPQSQPAVTQEDPELEVNNALPPDAQAFLDTFDNETKVEKAWAVEEGAEEVTVHVEWKLDYVGDTATLRKAMKGLGTDKEKLNGTLAYYAQVTIDDRQMVVNGLKEAYLDSARRDMEEDLKMELSGWYETLVMEVFSENPNYLPRYATQPTVPVHAREDGTCWVDIVVKKSEGWTRLIKGILFPFAGAERASSASDLFITEDLELSGNVMEYTADEQNGILVTNTYEKPVEPQPEPEPEPVPEPEPEPQPEPVPQPEPEKEEVKKEEPKKEEVKPVVKAGRIQTSAASTPAVFVSLMTLAAGAVVVLKKQH